MVAIKNHPRPGHCEVRSQQVQMNQSTLSRQTRNQKEGREGGRVGQILLLKILV